MKLLEKVSGGQLWTTTFASVHAQETRNAASLTWWWRTGSPSRWACCDTSRPSTRRRAADSRTSPVNHSLSFTPDAAPHHAAKCRNTPHDRRANGTSPIVHVIKFAYDVSND